MAKNAEVEAKARDIYRAAVAVAEIKAWFINNGEKLTVAQRRKFKSIWNISDRLSKKTYEFVVLSFK